MMRVYAVAFLIAVAGCAGGDDGEPVRLYGNHDKVIALIQEQYSDCLEQLGNPRIRFASDNIYVAYSETGGDLSWTAMSTNGQILVLPTKFAAEGLKTAGC